MINDFGYYQSIVKNLEQVNATQGENIQKAASLMADAIAEDRLIHVYGGGGHTTLCMGEMFFRAGGLSCINPVMETGLSVFNQALKYLELERTVNYGSAIMKYYDLQPGDLLIVFHNIGINPATIDAVMEAKKAGAKIIAVSSSRSGDPHRPRFHHRGLLPCPPAGDRVRQAVCRPWHHTSRVVQRQHPRR